MSGFNLKRTSGVSVGVGVGVGAWVGGGVSSLNVESLPADK